MMAAIMAREAEYFATHPEAVAYDRAPVPGEFWPAGLSPDAIVRVRRSACGPTRDVIIPAAAGGAQ